MPEGTNGSTRLVGVDVGGTTVKLGAIAPDGAVLGEVAVAVAGRSDVASVLDGVARASLELCGGKLEAGIGVGLPGLIDRGEGRVVESPNLPIFNGVHVRAELADRLGIPPRKVRIENDANVAALGEAWRGAARGTTHALVVTLGTGIGGGLILNGELFVGEGLAGEIGHVTIDPAGPPCGCGARGCLEVLASATAARRRARERGLPEEDPGDLELLTAVARRRAGPERELLHAIGVDLGHGLADALCLLDLRAFVFGGGFAAALDTLEAGIRQGLGEWAYGERVRQVRLARAALGPRAGWIGAARLTLTKTTPTPASP